MKGVMVWYIYIYVLGLTVFLAIIILCSQRISILVTDIYTHFSLVLTYLFLKLCINHSSLSSLPATASSKHVCIDWSAMTSSDIANYQDMLCDRGLVLLPS